MKTHEHQGSRAAVQAAPEAGGSGSARGKIVLRRDAERGCWVAQHVGTFAARHVLAALGTDTVETGYTCAVDADEVRGWIQIMNPGLLVEVA